MTQKLSEQIKAKLSEIGVSIIANEDRLRLENIEVLEGIENLESENEVLELALGITARKTGTFNINYWIDMARQEIAKRESEK